MIVGKTAFLLSLAMLIATTTGAKESPEELWKQQMDRLDEIIAEQKFEKEEPKQTGRMIGLPDFDIDFEKPPELMTVHTLRPEDIDIVGAMGDSLTAANGAGASTVAGLAIEYRGICFSAGGDEELEQSITMPNILKKFNPELQGHSLGVGPQLPWDQYSYGFNVAVPGARADDMPGQARRLIDLLKTDNRTSFENDWKLVTLFIGGNDLCALGRDPDGASPETYVAEIKTAVDLLHAEVPRMLLNIVDILEIYLLPQVGTGFGSTPQCRQLQQSFCGYVIDTQNDPVGQAHLIEINKQYQVQLKELIDSGIYETRDDFTVVIQPFLRDSVLPYTEDGQVDATYFAPDCFHFSDKGHAMGAINLWNNMLEPVGQKTTVWGITDLKVPTKDHPYIFTSQNSYPTSTPAPPSTTQQSASSTEVPVWVIVVMAVLVVALAAQLFAILCVLKSKNSKSANMNDDVKASYDNGGHVGEKV